MGIHIYLTAVRPTEVFSEGTTHNLTAMAKESGLYECIWHPEKLGVTTAAELVMPLKVGFDKLRADPERFKFFNPSNGWGSYDTFIKFVSDYIDACLLNPDSVITVSL